MYMCKLCLVQFSTKSNLNRHLKTKHDKLLSVLNVTAVAGTLHGSTHWAYRSRIARKQSLLKCQDQFGSAINYNDTIESTQAETISHLSLFKDILKSNIHTNILSLKANCWHVQFPNDKSICDNKWCSMLWLTKLNITSHHTTKAELWAVWH